MTQVVSTKQNLNKIENSHYFKLIVFITKYGIKYTRLLQIGGGLYRILTNEETDQVLKILEELPERDPHYLTRSFAESDLQLFGESFWINEELHKCYASRFYFNADSISVCEEPVDIHDILEHFRFKCLKFTHARYNYTIICRDTTPLTWEKTLELVKDTKIHLQTCDRVQELDENTMTRTYANISNSTWLDIVRHVLTNRSEYYCQKRYFTDIIGTSTIKIDIDPLMMFV